MSETGMQAKWLEWARRIQAIAQTGITYAVDDFQRERYHQLLEIAAQIVRHHTQIPMDFIIENFQMQPGYATPKVDVRGAVFHHGKLLMVREKLDRGWTMPGGWADVGDYPGASVEREVFEESGYQVKTRRLIGIYDANRVSPMSFYHAYKLVFFCEISGGEAKTGQETTAVSFFAENEIPVDLAGERTLPRHIRDAFAALNDYSIPTVFD